MKTFAFLAAIGWGILPLRGQVEPFLGIVMDTSRGDGVRVTWVEPGSPAAKAGIEAGAIVFGIGGKTVNGVAGQVTEVLGTKQAGDKIELRWCQREAVKIATITLGSRKEAIRAAGRERERIAQELRGRLSRQTEEAKMHFREDGELAVSPWPADVTKRRRLEAEIENLEKEARNLQKRAAELRETLGRLTE
ncbi:MAG TPA: PDZ domain-containing protein [Verrucomicrobiales bacterium]|nr:PDZ domain-containing protein [Verrucomicrobiales bacterium]